MSNYDVWTVEMLGARIIEWRERLRHAKDREQLLSIWGEVEKMEAAFDQAVFEGRVERPVTPLTSSSGSTPEGQDPWARARLAQLRVDEIALEARGCDDPERLAALTAEMRVIHSSLVEIRREQLMEQLHPVPVKRRWWRFGRGTQGQIRSTHPYAFRSGEWGQITGIFKYGDRDCFRVKWPQRDPKPDLETIDYWPVDDPSDTGREFR